MRKLLLLYVLLGLGTIIALSSCGEDPERISNVSQQIKAPKTIQYVNNYITDAAGGGNFRTYMIEGHKYIVAYHGHGIGILHMESCSCMEPINDTVGSDF